MQKVLLSVVIITKNEEDRIRECLESVKWADEIVVVDDHSTDRTVQIAKEYTDRIVQRQMDIEGRHRNFAYSLASREWVLSLDADERVTRELQDEITGLLTNSPSCNGYTIPRKNYIGRYWARHGGMYPSAQIKLFKKDEFRFEESEVHPVAIMKDPRGQLKSDIIHYTYRDMTDAIAKLDRQTTLEAKKWLRDGRKVSSLLICYKMIDRFRRSYFQKKGYRDGVIGLFMAHLAAMYQFLTYAKYWQEKQKGML